MQNMVIQNMCFISTNKQLYLIYILDGSTDFKNTLLRFEIQFKKRFNTLLYKMKDTFLKSLQYLFRTLYEVLVIFLDIFDYFCKFNIFGTVFSLHFM